MSDQGPVSIQDQVPRRLDEIKSYVAHLQAVYPRLGGASYLTLGSQLDLVARSMQDIATRHPPPAPLPVAGGGAGEAKEEAAPPGRVAQLEYAASDPPRPKTQRRGRPPVPRTLGVISWGHQLIIPYQDIFAHYGLKKSLGHKAVFTRMGLGSYKGKGLYALDKNLNECDQKEAKDSGVAIKWFINKELATRVASWCGRHVDKTVVDVTQKKEDVENAFEQAQAPVQAAGLLLAISDQLALS